jgi:N-acetylmuramoyl-L-alanine amidase
MSRTSCSSEKEPALDVTAGYRCTLASMLCAASLSCFACPAPLVAVDIGHSKSNPGAMSARGKPEFEFNLALAEAIRQELASRHVRTLLIGEDGTMEELPKRTAAAAMGGATFFLSVHHDSAQPRYLETWDWNGVEQRFTDRFSGFSLFVSRKNPRMEASLTCARAIGSALKAAGLAFSTQHAERIAGENREWADRNAGVYYFDNLAVLKTAKSPAVLLEAGVIVNRDDERTLQAPAMRRAIAGAVVRGLADCGAIAIDRE